MKPTQPQDPKSEGGEGDAGGLQGREALLGRFREARRVRPELGVTEFLETFLEEWAHDGAEGDSSGDVLLRETLDLEGMRQALEDHLFVLRGLEGLTDSGEEGGARGGRGSLEIPERIGAYRVLRRLGEGGMGTVYLVEQVVGVRRKAALKLIKPGMDSRQVLKRFEAERQALAMMEHGHIARVFDAETDEQGHPYFVMEYVDGMPIDAWCRDKRLGLEQRVRLFIRVCAGVQHAHQKGILHRDLKPSNVLVIEQDGEAMPKIIDFGLARAMDEESDGRSLMTLEGQVLGTPEYMAPEQACRAGEDIDSRADIYSLGVMLYQLITGTLPVPTEVLRNSGLLEMRRRICEEDCESPSTRLVQESRKAGADEDSSPCLVWQNKLRGDLDWITMMALAKDRERRYSSVSALAEDLRRYLDHEPVLAGPPSGLYRVKKLLRKHRVFFGALLVILLSLSLAVIVMLQAYGEARRKEREARASLAVMRETLGTMRDLTGMGDEGIRHGDQVRSGWTEDFESYVPAGNPDKIVKFDLPRFDPKAPRGRDGKGPWHQAADNREIFLERGVDGAQGAWCLRMAGVEGVHDGAQVARWVDPRYRSFVGDFTLELSFRFSEARGSGLSCLLGARPNWAPAQSPDRQEMMLCRLLFSIAEAQAGEHAGELRLKIPWGEGMRELATVELRRFHKLRIHYQRLAGSHFRVSARLDGHALRVPSEQESPVVFEHEQQLRWMQFGARAAPVWIDAIQLRRTLPHDPWFRNPENEHYYTITPRPMRVEEARDYARLRGGVLGRFADDEERRWIRRTFGRFSFFVGVSRGVDADGRPGPWVWDDPSWGPVAPELWLGAKTPTLGKARQAALGGYRHLYPEPRSGEGALVPVEAGRDLYALIQFDKKPIRESFGRLAGDLQWARSLGGQSLEEDLPPIASVVADRDPDNPGGALVCGTFRREAVLGREPAGQGGERLVVRASGGTDAFVAKYDREGRILWARVIGGAGIDQARGVAVDGEGRVFVTGAFSERARLRVAGGGGMQNTSWSLESSGQRDLFVAGFSPAGLCEWMQRLGGAGDDTATGVSFAKSGRLFVSACVEGELRRGTDAQDDREDERTIRARKAFGKQDILLACFLTRQGGRLSWLRRAGGPRKDGAQAVAALSDGSVVITGAFQGRARFGRTESGEERSFVSESTRPDEQQNNLFVACYRSNGDLAWVRHPGGPGGRTVGHALAAGEDGSCYVAGAIDQNIYFGGPQMTYRELDALYSEASEEVLRKPGLPSAVRRMEALMPQGSSGWVDAFLVKYDRRGQACWAVVAKGHDGSNIPYGLDVAPDGSILMTGRIQGACVFGEGRPGKCLRSSDSIERPDIFLAKYRPKDGGLSWVRTARGPGANWGSSVAALGSERALVVGGLHGPTNFGEGEPTMTTLARGTIFMSAFHTVEKPPAQAPKRAR